MATNKNQTRSLFGVCLSSVILLVLSGCATQQAKSAAESTPAINASNTSAAQLVAAIPTLPAPMHDAMDAKGSITTQGVVTPQGQIARPKQAITATPAIATTANLEIPAAELSDIWEDIVTESETDAEPAPANIAIIDDEADQDIETSTADQNNAADNHKARHDPNSVAESPIATKSATSLAINTTQHAINVMPDLWDRIRARFSMPGRDHPRVQFSKNWYAKRQDYLDRTIERATPYLHYIVAEVERRNMPSELVLLPFVESAFQPLANSHASAAGIWQFIPSTARHYGLKLNWWYDGRRDIHASTSAALDYLQKLGDQFNGDWLLALAAYNAGEGTVQRAIDRNRRAGKPTDYWSVKLPKETRAYVPWLLAITEVVADPGKYNIALKSIPDAPYLANITTTSQIDLALAAELAELPLEEIHKLNPAYNRWVTDPSGPHHLLLPIEKIDAFQEKLASLPMEKRVRWTRHEVKKGESLGNIARLYGTTTDLLRQINKLNGNVAKARANLLIPVQAQDLGHYVLRIAEMAPIPQAPQQDLFKRRGKKGSTHIVRRGDTLLKVARRYGLSASQLATLNNIQPTTKLAAGQRLVLRARATGKTKSSRTVATTTAGTRHISYKIRPGDTLARIAERFDVSVAELRKWNAPAKVKSLKAGEKLMIKTS